MAVETARVEVVGGDGNGEHGVAAAYARGPHNEHLECSLCGSCASKGARDGG
jgi:hypothetical protein